MVKFRIFLEIGYKMDIITNYSKKVEISHAVIEFKNENRIKNKYVVKRWDVGKT